MEENIIEKKSNNSQQQIVGAIIIAGIIIAGAVLLKGSSVPAKDVPISKMVGLNVKSFDACLSSGKFKDKVQANIDDGNTAGVTGTPSSFILKNGKVIDTIGGALPYTQVMQKVTNALKEERGVIATEIKPVTSEDHIKGNINAKIIIVEYSDLDCPFCKIFHETMNKVITENGEDVAWVYRHYPITQLHPNAFRKAEATECAWEQKGNKAFWEYSDKLFESKPSNNNIEEVKL